MFSSPEHQWSWTLSQRLTSDTDDAHKAIERLESALHGAGWEGRDLFHVRMAVEEGLVNAIEHGNKRDPMKHVDLEFRVSREACFIRITDEGPGFCRSNLKSCIDDDCLDKPRGRGVWLIEQFMSESAYNDRGNQLTMIRKRNDPQLAIAED
jgi:serine/threonine-protein kinase RsbW